MHYYLIRSRESFEKGAFFSAEPSDAGIRFKKGDYAAFLSGVTDSRSEGLLWSRLYAFYENDAAALQTISVYSSDVGYIEDKNHKKLRLAEFLKSEAMDMSEKKLLMRAYLRKREELREQVGLVNVKGRYIWFLIESEGVREDFSLNSVYLCFGSAGWENYLPEIYRTEGGDFLKRYLAMLQSIYEETEERIRTKADSFDPYLAGNASLERLAELIGFSEIEGAEPEAKRRLLKNAARLFKRRGTKQALEEAVELYLGERAYLLEYKDIYRNGELRNLGAGEIYDINEYACMLVIAPKSPIEETRLKAAVRIAEGMLPAQIELKTVVLSEGAVLGAHTYLGMNTKLGEYKEARLDGRGALSFVRLKGERENKYETD